MPEPDTRKTSARWLSRFHRELVHPLGQRHHVLCRRHAAPSLTDATYKRRVNAHKPGDREAAIKSAIRSWQKLIRLIAAHDVEGAIAHWSLHLENVGKRLPKNATALAAEVSCRRWIHKI